MDNQLIQKRLAILSPEYRTYIAEAALDETITIIAAEEDFSDEQVALCNNAVGLFLLGFFDTDQAVAFLTAEANLEYTLARAVFGAVLSTVPSDILAAQSIIHTELTPAEAGTTPNTPTNPVTPVPGVRTMANDAAEAQAEPTYSSSQDALLKPPIPAPPNPNQPPPR